METFWKPQPASAPLHTAAPEKRKACGHGRKLHQTARDNHPGGDGKEGVDGSSPSEGSAACLQIVGFGANAGTREVSQEGTFWHDVAAVRVKTQASQK